MKEKGYTGFDFSDVEEEDDIVSRLATLKINMDSECEYSFILSKTAADSRLDSCMCLFLQTLFAEVNSCMIETLKCKSI